MTTTANIQAIAEALQDRLGVRALFLSGSHGSGLADAYSDLDFLAVAVDGPTDAFASLWREAVGRIGEIVLWWDRQANPMLINAITAEWVRMDVEVVTPQQMAARSGDGLKALFDHDRILDSLPAALGRTGPNAARMKWQFEEFIRILGLLPLAMGREEYLNSITGVGYLRSLLVDLLIEETAAPNRGGALRLNRLITQEQKDSAHFAAAAPADQRGDDRGQSRLCRRLPALGARDGEAAGRRLAGTV